MGMIGRAFGRRPHRYRMVTTTRTVWLVATVAVAGAGCATTKGAPTPVDVDAAIRARTAASGLRLDGQEPLPPDVNLADGLTQEEAVAIALWNSPSFQATLADLGVARADLVEAGLLRNPILSLLFPLGPKQLEFTLQFPFDAAVAAPGARRRGAAQCAGGRRASRLGCALAGRAGRSAHADAVVADRRLALATENAELTRRLADITDARLRAGDISELEARAPRSDALAHRRRAPRRAARSRPRAADAGSAARPRSAAGSPAAATRRPPTTPRRARRRCPVQGCARVSAGRPRGGAGDRSRHGARPMGALARPHADRHPRRQRRGQRRVRDGSGRQRDLPIFNRNQGGDRARRRRRSSAPAGSMRRPVRR